MQLRLLAPTLEALFEEAARALAELIAENLAEGPTGVTEWVKVRAPDREALLVDWLNELIFRAETHHRVYQAHILRLSDQELEAEIRGVEPQGWRTEVKAATFHRLSIADGKEGYTATVVLDV